MLDLTHMKQNLNEVDLMLLYHSLIGEEFKEFFSEPRLSKNSFKELCDLLWVCVQFANVCGFDLSVGMSMLMREYKSKLYDSEGNFSATYNQQGKLMKGRNFKKLDIDELVKNGLTTK